MDDHTFDPKAAELRRFEVITGTGRRRNWPPEVKARIVAESLAPGARVSDVARRHEIRPQQLFGWRRETRTGQLPVAGEEGTAFVPLVASLPSGPAAAEAGACIEIEMRGVVVRMRGRIAAGSLAEVLAAVKSVT
jgi:transposase